MLADGLLLGGEIDGEVVARGDPGEVGAEAVVVLVGEGFGFVVVAAAAGHGDAEEDGGGGFGQVRHVGGGGLVLFVEELG